MLKGVYKFSDLLKISNLQPDIRKGCLVDTSILFAYSYPNDLFHKVSSELFDFLSDLKIPVYTNANIRAEFINNYFQVLVPESLNDLYQYPNLIFTEELRKKLASNYAILYEARGSGKSYKFNSGKVNEWKTLLRKSNQAAQDGWFAFCSSFINHKLTNIWDSTCDEAGVNFLSLRGSDQKEWMTGPLDWNDMVSIVGNYGLGSFDAMITNLLMNSHFEGLITADADLARAVSHISSGKKLIFVPDKMQI